jgi:hypothetical protein
MWWPPTNLIRWDGVAQRDAVDLPHSIAPPASILALCVSADLIRPGKYLVCHRQFSISMIFIDTASIAM